MSHYFLDTQYMFSCSPSVELYALQTSMLLSHKSWNISNKERIAAGKSNFNRSHQAILILKLKMSWSKPTFHVRDEEVGVLDGPGLYVLVLQDEGVEGGRVRARPLDERRRMQQLKHRQEYNTVLEHLIFTSTWPWAVAGFAIKVTA